MDLDKKLELLKNYIRYWLDDPDIELTHRIISHEDRLVAKENKDGSFTESIQHLGPNLLIEVIPKKFGLIYQSQEGWYAYGMILSDGICNDDEWSWSKDFTDFEEFFKRDYLEELRVFNLESLPIDYHYPTDNDYSVHKYIMDFFKGDDRVFVGEHYIPEEDQVEIHISAKKSEIGRPELIFLAQLHMWYNCQTREFQFRVMAKDRKDLEIGNEKKCQWPRSLEVAKKCCLIENERISELENMDDFTKNILADEIKKSMNGFFGTMLGGASNDHQ